MFRDAGVAFVRPLGVRRWRKVLFCLLSVIVAAFLTGSPLFAQLSTGNISGAVTDQTGAVIPGATVTVTDTQTGTSRVLKSNRTGQYAAPNLLPGVYAVSAVAAGFQTVERTGVNLEVGQSIRINLTLKPGVQVQKVTVTAAAPLINTTDATLGGTLSTQTINQLPLNGRDFENLLTLRPGTSIYPGGGPETQSTNGLRAQDQVYLIDGLNNMDPYTGYNLVNTVNLAGETGTMISIDAIQQFNIEEQPQANTGWKSGGVVNVGIKSGTNHIHGSAFAFGRDTALDARNYFNNPPQPNEPVSLQQFGGTVGGPIKRNKLFYFLSYEGQRYSVGNFFVIKAPVTVALPTPDPSASLVDACNAVPQASRSANSLKIAGMDSNCNYVTAGLPGLFPVNNGPTTTMINTPTSGQTSNNGIARIDYHVNANNEINGTYFYGLGVGSFADSASIVQPEWMSDGTMRLQMGSGSWTWTPNARWTNLLMVGFDRFYRSFLGADASINPQHYVINGANYSLNTGVTDPRKFGFPQIQFNSFPFGLFHLGANWPKIVGPDEVVQAQDNVSYLKGNHDFTFGAQILFDGSHTFITHSGKGRIRFKNLTTFFEGITNSHSQIYVGDPTRNVHTYGFATFAMDSWRATPKLTLNYGLRWEMVTSPVEANNLIGNFSPTQGLVQVGKQISRAFNSDKTNFAPRFGMAWDMFGNGTTVMRGGIGIFYDELNVFQQYMGIGNTFGLATDPTGAIINASGATSGGNINLAMLNFGTGALNWNGSSVGGASIFPTGTLNCYLNPCSVFSVDPNLKTPFATEWSLEIEHSITNNLAMTVGYVGNHGSNQLSLMDINEAPVGSGYAPGCTDPTACEQAARPYAKKFPYLSNIVNLGNLDISNYNSLQATLTARNFHGLSFLAGYTYGHALDEQSQSFNGTYIPMVNSASALRQEMYASGDYDIRHRFTLSATYNIPGIKSPGQLLQGWQISSIVTLQSGLPWYAQDYSNDFSGTGEVGVTASGLERWDFFGNTADFTSNNHPFPYCTGTAAGVTNCQAPTATGLLPASQAASDWSNCMARASALPKGPAGQTGLQSLVSFGCYVSPNGRSVLVPPALGTVGTAGRNIFRDSGFRDWDFSVLKNMKLGERLNAQFRAEFFNVLNHPSFANPLGGVNGYANNDVSAGYGMGCGCITPDQAATNPVLGVGGARDIQLGLKLLF